MPKTMTLEDAFVEEIRDLYDAEKQIVRSLPKLAKAAQSEELKTAFKEHLEQTKGQVQRLEQVFEMLEQKARSKPCKGMKGLLEEGQELIEESKSEGPLMDLELIGAAQKVEHYEISGYGTVRTFAQQMGNRDVAELLDQTLKEEEQTDKRLTAIAKALYKEAVRMEKSAGQEENGGGGRGRSSRSGGPTSAAGRKRAQEPEETDEADMEMDEEEEEV